ncbi:carbohydrate ABC transporter permease [Microvirga lotononidis]|uniref:Permease component of ABC-type sugar transporter n=1 Tax=Microvirga lotononidis TaxID=864069 RepID=I4YYE9_9HYPH|nr:sugar ABC transporter permease [Microvirga lotononidis]EIM28991.1 permease component of ABC-type sugar transporter [Microvirga lotononidis]WQO26905.1 sugar ABC transporter permease [Microvirga lotononidis]
MTQNSYADSNIRWIYPLPAILFVALLMVFPVLYTTYISLTNWTLTSGAAPSFVGLDNYAQVLIEPRFLQALWRTMVFTVSAVAVEAVLGVAAALLLNRAFVGRSVVKLLLLLPLVATPVAVGIVFNLFYDPTIGLANYVLEALGLPPSSWISAASTVIFSLVVVDVWQWTPMITLIVLAGLAALSDEPAEAARIDGANEWQIIRLITIPMVMPVIITAVILRLIDALKTFDIIFAMTGGGPGYASETLNLIGYKYSFEYFRMGQAAVILVVLFLVVLACSVAITRLNKRTAT